MPFHQTPPSLGNQYRADRVLTGTLRRALPEDVFRDVEPSLDEMGQLAGGPLFELIQDDRSEPVLTSWDAWGNRVDRVELTPLWKAAGPLAAEKGLIALAYERLHGRFSRLHQMALAYLFEPSSGVYACPLAMTDGAAKTLTVLGNQELVARAVPRLTSRDPARAWTSGQWMTERTGGSDVSRTETVAWCVDGQWRLYGTKWFTSAISSEMALTLARVENGLALFYVETHDAEGRPNGLLVNRLKEKLGTRMVPTAELTLDGAVATPVKGLVDGVKNITPMLQITRVWNSVGAVAGMRRALALALDYAGKREAFGTLLADKALHVETLADMTATFEGAFLLTFRAVELLGREETGTLGEGEAELLRLITPIVKLTTGKQVVAVTSEALECFGGAGYVEDTGLPRLLRDAQVLPIWEGTTNVLSLDLLRALGKTRSLDPIAHEIARATAGASSDRLRSAAERAHAAAAHASAWLSRAASEGPEAVEAGARRLALTLGLALELALLVEHAAWAAARGDTRSSFAAERLARRGVDLVEDRDTREEARALLG